MERKFDRIRLTKKKVEPTNVDKILFKARKVFLLEEIDSDSALDIVKGLRALDEINKKPIIMYINSVGGNVDSGLAIIDAIQTLKSDVTTYVTGTVCSMAALISIVGRRRLMTINGIWMIHPTKEGIFDNVETIKDRMKGIALCEKIFDRLLNKYTKLSKEEKEKSLRGEVWLDAKQCLEKGVVDKIV